MDVKTYVDCASLFFEPGFQNFKREKSLTSMLIPKEMAKQEMQKAVTEYVTKYPDLAEMEMRQLSLHVNGYSVHEITPELVKKKMHIMADIFFKSGFEMIRKKYRWAMMFVNNNDAHQRMHEGIDWYVDNDFISAKSKLLSLRMLLEMRLEHGKAH